MGPGLTSFLITVSGCTWIYTKFMRKTGNNTKTTLIAVTVCGVVIFLVMFSILSIIFK